MIYPNFLQKADTIGIPAPSAGAWDDEKKNKFKNAEEYLECLGYKLKISENIYNCQKGRSGNAITRASELNEMFENNDVNLILCAAGGDFLVEILPYVDFNILSKNPKFVAGFSDPTGILYPITTKYDIATIYGQNFSTFGAEKLHKSELDFLEILKGNMIVQHSFDFYEGEQKEEIEDIYTEPVYWNTLNEKNVEVSGRIIGGCFDIISELAGTKYDGINEFNQKYKNDGIIWYFDNCEISMEETIRTLWKMNELEYFKYTKAIIFGRFGVNTSFYGYDVKSCLQDSVISNLNIPIIYDADISHKSPCLTIINGAIANVSVTNGNGLISFELK